MRQAVNISVPGDKSITHRALILASVAAGESRIRGALDAADTQATAAILARLGVAVSRTGGEMRITGKGLDALVPPDEDLDCGNSGTTARLLLGVLAGCPFEATLTGDPSLRSRPMRRVTAPLAVSGARFHEIGEVDRLPVRVRGRRPLDPIRWRSPVASAQVKSALLLAGITGRATVEVMEPMLSRDHTERMLQAMGVSLGSHQGPEGHTVRMDAPDRLEPLDLDIPGDLSSGAWFLGLAAVAGPVRLRGVGLNPTRTGVLDALARMGASVDRMVMAEHGAEPVGDVVVAPAELAGVRVPASEIPALIDEIPVLAVLATRARGETRFDGVGELRYKESDRVAALADNLRRLGVGVEVGPEHLAVQGTEAPLKGAVDTRGDHRIDMAFHVLAAMPGNRIDVRGEPVVDVSFPGFHERLEAVRKELVSP